MKKRPKPILLMTLLGVLVVTAVGFNFMQNPPKDDHSHAPEQQHEEEEPVLAGSRSPSDTSGKANDVASVMTGGAQPKKPPSAPGGPTPGPGGPGAQKPSLLRPSVGSMKPKPNDSSTSAQWYSSEHNQGN